MPCICNTKITCRIHLIAPRRAFRCLTSMTRKYNVHLSLRFTVEREVSPAAEETGVNKDHVAETHALISLSPSSERS